MPSPQPTALNLQLYDHLLQFQLFQGMSRNELLQLAGNTRFGFQKLQPGKLLIHEGDDCQQLFFLIKGQTIVEHYSDDHAYHVTEWLSAPWLLQPEALFGLSPRYTLTARANTETHFFTLSKDEVLRLLDDFLIVRLNLLNLLATQSQRYQRSAWRRTPRTLEERIARFFTSHAIYPAGLKEIHILMEQLAAEVTDTRLNVSRVLNDMQRRNLIQLHRGRIVIPMLERLFM